MKIWRVLPWKAVARRVSRRHGFVDPITLFDRLRQFAQPSEVGEPVELLRAGAVFHARGLINRTVQFNLDWVWPYWIERQFDPLDESFVPRAFSFSHINLTHRNWTAVGLPDLAHYPIVDPRGLVTPLFDGWSVDFWVLDERCEPVLLPSRTKECEQSVTAGDELRVTTRVFNERARMELVTWMEEGEDGSPVCVSRAVASGPANALLAVAVRPYNPEGISFIDTIESLPGASGWRINGRDTIRFGEAPVRGAMSCYSAGDVLTKLQQPSEGRGTWDGIRCPAGMATAAAVFRVNNAVELRLPVVAEGNGAHRRRKPWRDELAGLARLQIPDPLWQRLYDTALATLILHAPEEVYPGPYTYKRFWYRDAALILHALACAGAHERCRRALNVFPRGQTADGYFRSQEGEWDSNGEVLWILERSLALSGERLPEEWVGMIERGARWIMNKRMRGGKHPGLLPAGFSAEHLGLNDYYFWDDFWGVAGLRAATRLMPSERIETAREFQKAADEFLRTINESIETSESYRRCGAVPAAPDRRMDAGAIGSLVADYPLQLGPPGDARMLKTADWLVAHSFVRGGFFQNMIHSGINAYLTLHVAQVLLRGRDVRVHELIHAVAQLASPTGQWPEAIHPRTLGGCMGDGQHVWAAAEWVLMMRALFLREEGETLVVAPGLPREWLGSPLYFGPAATTFGPVTIEIQRDGDRDLNVRVQGTWRRPPGRIELALPGYQVAGSDGVQYRLRPA